MTRFSHSGFYPARVLPFIMLLVVALVTSSCGLLLSIGEAQVERRTPGMCVERPLTGSIVEPTFEVFVWARFSTPIRFLVDGAEVAVVEPSEAEEPSLPESELRSACFTWRYYQAAHTFTDLALGHHQITIEGDTRQRLHVYVREPDDPTTFSLDPWPERRDVEPGETLWWYSQDLCLLTWGPDEVEWVSLEPSPVFSLIEPPTPIYRFMNCWKVTIADDAQPGDHVIRYTARIEDGRDEVTRATLTVVEPPEEEPGIIGDWDVVVTWVLDADAPALCGDPGIAMTDEGVASFSYDAGGLTVWGFGDPGAAWAATQSGTALSFGGERSEDAGVTTATFTVELDSTGTGFSGTETWKWKGTDGAGDPLVCTGTSIIEAKKQT